MDFYEKGSKKNTGNKVPLDYFPAPLAFCLSHACGQRQMTQIVSHWPMPAVECASRALCSLYMNPMFQNNIYVANASESAHETVILNCFTIIGYIVHKS